jgi:hypothetical protein
MELIEKDEKLQNGKLDEKLTISISTSDVNAQQHDSDKEKHDKQTSLFHILKEHLTCEMYDAILIVCSVVDRDRVRVMTQKKIWVMTQN